MKSVMWERAVSDMRRDKLKIKGLLLVLVGLDVISYEEEYHEFMVEYMSRERIDDRIKRSTV